VSDSDFRSLRLEVAAIRIGLGRVESIGMAEGDVGEVSFIKRCLAWTTRFLEAGHGFGLGNGSVIGPTSVTIS